MSPKSAKTGLFLAQWILMTAVIHFTFKSIGDVWYRPLVLFVGLYVVIRGFMQLRNKYDYLFK